MTFEFILGTISGMIIFWLLSKYYIYKHPKEWKKFKKTYENSRKKMPRM